MPCWRKVLVLSHDTMTPLQKQQNPISKHRYVQAPKGFFGYRKINLQVVKIHPPKQNPGGNLLKLSAPRCNSLTPILVTATSQWTEQLAGNAAADRLLGKGTRTRTVTGCAIPSRRSTFQSRLGSFPFLQSSFPEKDNCKSHWVHPHLHPLSRKTCHSLEVLRSSPHAGRRAREQVQPASTSAVSSWPAEPPFLAATELPVFSVLDGDQLHWDQYHWTVSKIQPPRLEKHPFRHHSNFISRGVIPDKFQTGPNQKSSSENGLYTCYDSYFAASLLKSKQNNQTFLNRDFSLFPRTVWS